MKIHPSLLDAYPELNPQQLEVVGHIDGPLLVIAGPGSGKTYSLVLRTLNLILLGCAEPKEIVLSTFTEKAAYEMRDRLAQGARAVGVKLELSQLLVGTIHGISNRFVTRYRHLTDLGHGYETLDDLTQQLFIFDHFREIVGEQDEGERYLGRWQSRWYTIKTLAQYFNKITEELIDPEELVASHDRFQQALGRSYVEYLHLLLETNHVDFAHQQKFFLELLDRLEIGPQIMGELRYVLVDEYQDTNYIQEQLMLRLAGDDHNICVVGDEDQSLYRFRGATVRNILEFPQHFSGCEVVKLTTNYRSHESIIRAYDDWMESADWSGSDGRRFRYDKHILPDDEADFLEYPAIFRVWGEDERDEAVRFANLVEFLKSNDIISDYSQVVLLLHSVRSDHSGRFIDALEAKDIPAFCPRARAYFDEEEVRLIVGAFAVILSYFDQSRGEIRGRGLKELADYVDDCIIGVGSRYGDPHPLARIIQRAREEIEGLREGESLDRRLADYFYELIAVEPFSAFIKDENRAQRLAIFSTLLNIFQTYYHFSVLTYDNRGWLKILFFNSFLRLLYQGGINDYEDPDQPLPKGYVQVMTVHQAKGLEFPVVVVGSLDKQLSTQKQIDKDLAGFYHRPPFEPEDRITSFDRMRLHYVAFSRAEKVLVLTCGTEPKDYFEPIWKGLSQWPYVKKDLLASQRFELKERLPLKKSYSFTGDLRVYETCPRQYQFFRHYDFTPSRSTVIFFGLLVHRTIEDVHRIVLDGGLDSLDEPSVEGIFERIYDVLLLSDVRPPGPEAKAAALRQVKNYWRQNQEAMKRIIDCEVDVSVEKDGYILTGKVDLMLGGDGKLELLDFKTQEKPDDPELFSAYEQQLCLYGHILEQRYGKHPERLIVYWTAEPRLADAVTVFPYRPEKADQAGEHFSQVVERIQAEEFRVITPPERKICKECDVRSLCVAEEIIEPFG